MHVPHGRRQQVREGCRCEHDQWLAGTGKKLQLCRCVEQQWQEIPLSEIVMQLYIAYLQIVKIYTCCALYMYFCVHPVLLNIQIVYVDKPFVYHNTSHTGLHVREGEKSQCHTIQQQHCCTVKTHTNE